jgi:hypothetical protein
MYITIREKLITIKVCLYLTTRDSCFRLKYLQTALFWDGQKDIKFDKQREHPTSWIAPFRLRMVDVTCGLPV